MQSKHSPAATALVITVVTPRIFGLNPFILTERHGKTIHWLRLSFLSIAKVIIMQLSPSPAAGLRKTGGGLVRGSGATIILCSKKTL